VEKGSVVEIPCDFDHKSLHSGLPDDKSDENYLISASEPHHFEPGSGKTIGEHNGAHFFTIGQRKGINIGGFKEPLFVIGTDIKKNLLYVGEGQSHPGLYRKGLFIKSQEVHWLRRDLEMNENEAREYEVRIRYRQPLQKAKLFRKKNGIFIIFHKLQRGIAPGQFAAWYNGDELIGSGVIDR
jgi:tRNA-specific 2-thiouridylase